MVRFYSKRFPVVARMLPLALLLIGAVLLLAVTGCDSKPSNWEFTTDRSTKDTNTPSKSQDNSSSDGSTKQSSQDR